MLKGKTMLKEKMSQEPAIRKMIGEMTVKTFNSPAQKDVDYGEAMKKEDVGHLKPKQLPSLETIQEKTRRLHHAANELDTMIATVYDIIQFTSGALFGAGPSGGMMGADNDLEKKVGCDGIIPNIDDSLASAIDRYKEAAKSVGAIGVELGELLTRLGIADPRPQSGLPG